MSINVNESCVQCEESVGTYRCNSCEQIFCLKHVNEHQEQIQKNFEDLFCEEEQFENALVQNVDCHSFFGDIDLWKRESIEQIKLLAKQAKENLRNLIRQSNEQMFDRLKEFQENLHLFKQSERRTEIHLNKLTNQLNLLKKQIFSFQLKKSSNVNYCLVEKVEEMIPIPTKEVSSNKISLPKIEEIHLKKEGPISIREIDPYGHFLIIENTGDKDQDMVGWIFKRSIDSFQTVLYRFPNDFILKSKCSIKILSRQASRTIYSYEKRNILIADAIQTWGTPANIIVNRLYDANGDEKHVLSQQIHFNLSNHK